MLGGTGGALMKKELSYAVGAVVLVLAIYAGAYYAMIGSVAFANRPGGGFMTVPVYRLFPDFSSAFFEPIHQFDKRIRPESWPEVDPEP
jgi:hypothetical protein